MSIKDGHPTLGELLPVLARWNRWGEAKLAPGVPRRMVDGLRPFLESSEVVALIGPRRAGKTTVLFQVMDVLEVAGVSREAILHLNLEEPGLGPLLDGEILERLYRTYRVEVFPEGRAFLFLDEIQHVPGWERWVRARSETEDVKIFVTGSSAALMAPELATLLTGRHVTFDVRPLDFREFLTFRSVEVPRRLEWTGNQPRLEHELNAFLRWGGFPEVVLAEDERRKETLLKQYFDDVLFKDVAIRHRIRDLTTLRNLAVYLLGQTGSLISLQRLKGIFGVSLELARSYCAYLEEAFVVSFVPYYTLKTAERLRRPRKIHAVDLGLRNVVSLRSSPDRGHVIETAVYNGVAGEDHDGIFFWAGDGEVDLVVRQGLEVKTLIQVTDEGLMDSGAKARELRSLAAARAVFADADPYVVAGRIPETGLGEQGAGIRAIPVWQFLAGRR